MSNFIQSIHQSLQINSLHLNSYQIEQLRKGERAPLIDGSARRYSTTCQEEDSTKSSKAKFTTNTSIIGVSWGVAAFLLVNTALGAGMLNYPYAYNQVGGVLPATLMQIVSN